MIDFVKCQNCGGILENGKCPFCGADYNYAEMLKRKSEKAHNVDREGKELILHRLRKMLSEAKTYKEEACIMTCIDRILK